MPIVGAEVQAYYWQGSFVELYGRYSSIMACYVAGFAENACSAWISPENTLEGDNPENISSRRKLSQYQSGFRSFVNQATEIPVFMRRWTMVSHFDTHTDFRIGNGSLNYSQSRTFVV
jgi:hypothetical protein